MGFESQLNNISSSVTFDMLLRPYVLIAFITGDVLKKNIYMTDDFELFKIGKLFWVIYIIIIYELFNFILNIGERNICKSINLLVKILIGKKVNWIA